MRICVPGELSAVGQECCAGQTGTAEVALLAGASVLPPGDIVGVRIAREAVEGLLEKLHVLKVPEAGSISVSIPELVVSGGDGAPA